MAGSQVGFLRRTGVVAVLAVAVGGCFTYRLAGPSGVRRGELVRVTLTPGGAADLTQQLGPRVETLDGRMLGASDGGFSVAVTQLTRTHAAEEFWTGDSVAVPARGVSSVLVRQFDRKRSAWAAGGALVALVAMRQVIVESGVFGSSGSRSPGSK